jgi:hypothetical protein
VVPVVDPCSAFTASISFEEIIPTPIVYPSGTTFIFTSCTTNSMVVQTTYPPTNIVTDDILKNTSGQCYTYIGNFVNYIPPVGFIIANIDMFTATTQTAYIDCIDCLAPTPISLPYVQWRGKAEYSLACPVCELTDFGGDYGWYTSSASTTLQTGVYVYEDSNLTIPLYVDYIKYSNKIYTVDSQGKITEYCTVNGNCT